MKRRVTLLIALVVCGTIALFFLVRWAMRPGYCMCELLDSENTRPQAREMMISHFGPIVLTRNLPWLYGERHTADQNSLYQLWKWIETVYRFQAIIICEWIALCTVLILYFWGKRRQQPPAGDRLKAPPEE